MDRRVRGWNASIRVHNCVLHQSGPDAKPVLLRIAGSTASAFRVSFFANPSSSGGSVISALGRVPVYGKRTTIYYTRYVCNYSAQYKMM